MRVSVEAVTRPGIGLVYQLRIWDGYRAGEFVRTGEQPIFDVEQERLEAWARNTGYKVVTAVYNQAETPEDLAVFRASRAASPIGEAMRQFLNI